MNRDNNAFYWLPCSVVFVCSVHEDSRDIMTATAMFVSEKEPLLAISVARNHLTQKLIDQSRRFIVVIAGPNQKELAIQVGSVKGEKVDKFDHFSIQHTCPEEGYAPVPEGAAAWIACEVESTHDIAGYRIFVGRVVGQEDMGKQPIVWHKDIFFGLKPV